MAVRDTLSLNSAVGFFLKKDIFISKHSKENKDEKTRADLRQTHYLRQEVQHEKREEDVSLLANWQANCQQVVWMQN